MIAYVRQGDRLVYAHQVGDYEVAFSARNVRKEASGVHARVDILANGVNLAYSTFNVEKDEDRVRISNSAYRQFSENNRNGLKDSYPSAFLKKDLDLFCDGLWDETVAASMPDLCYGSEERRSPSFLLKPFIMEEAGTVIFGPPGMGKSYMMITMAVCLDAGLSRFWPVQQRPTLFVNLERPRRTVEDRLGNINAALGFDRRRPLLMLHARGRGFLDVMEGIERAVHERGIGDVFVDSISRAGLGDLNDNVVANKIADALNGLGVAWVALAHPPRSDATHMYGSQMFDAAADLQVRLHSQQEERGPLGVGLEITKKNDIPDFPMRVLALEFDDSGLTGIREGRRGEFPDVEHGKKVTMRQAVKAHLLDTGKGTASHVADQLGYPRQNVSQLFNNDDTFVQVEKVGRDVFYGVRTLPSQA